MTAGQPHPIPPHPDVLAFGPNVAVSVPWQAEVSTVVYRCAPAPPIGIDAADAATLVEIYIGVEGSGGLYVTMPCSQVGPLIEALESARAGEPGPPHVHPASRWAPPSQRVR